MSSKMIHELFINKKPKNIRNSFIADKNLSLDELALTKDQIISSAKESAAKNPLFVIDHNLNNQLNLTTVKSFQLDSLEKCSIKKS